MAKLNGRVDAAPDRESTLQILTQFFGAGGANSGTNGTVVNNNNITIHEHYDAPSQSSGGNQVDASLLRAATTLESSVGALAQLLGNDQGAKDLLDGYRTAIRELRQGEDWHYSRQRGEAKSQREVDTLIESLQNPAKFIERMNDRWDAMTSMGQRGGFTVGQSMRDKFLQSSSAYAAITDNPLKQAHAALDWLTRMGSMDRDVANAISANGFKAEASQLRRGLTPDEIAANKSAQRQAEKVAEQTAEAAKRQVEATEAQTKATEAQTNQAKRAAKQETAQEAPAGKPERKVAHRNKDFDDAVKAMEEAASNAGGVKAGGAGRGKGGGNTPTGDEGHGPEGYQYNKATPIYTSWGNLLKDLAARGMHEVAEALSTDVGKRLGTGNIEGAISGIKGSFDKDGNLIGVSFGAQSSQYGKLGTAKMQYGFGQNEETGKYQVSGGIVQTSADVKRIEAERTKLDRDIASTESRINTLLNKDIVKEKTLDGKNSALYDSLMSIVGGSGTLGASGFQLNNGTNRAQLNDLNNQLDSFDGNLKSLNDRMRQDFSNRGIDDISNKAEKYQADAKTYLQQFGKMGIELKDINAVTKTGTAVGSLWDQFQKASEAFTQAQGDATKRVEAFNKMSDASKQLAAAYKVEGAAQRLSKPAAQALQGAEKALALPNAEAATKQYEALGQALDKLKEADTPAKTKNATDQVQAATKELQAAVKQIDTLDKKMAGADKWMQGKREKLSDAGMKIGDVASLKQASRVISNYKQAQTLDARQKWADQWNDAIQSKAAMDTRQALKKQKTATRMAKQDEAIETQMTTARQVLASAGLDKNSAVAKELQNALNGMELAKNWQNFEKRGQTMGNLKEKIAAAEKSIDEITKFDAKSGLYALKKSAQDKQFAELEGRNGGRQNWTADQQALYTQLDAQQSRLRAAFDDKNTAKFNDELRLGAELFRQLNNSLKESEQATDKANKAKEQADKQAEADARRAAEEAEKARADAAKEAQDRQDAIMEQGDSARQRMEQLQGDDDYRNVSAELKQKMTDAAEAFDMVSDLKNLGEFQTAVKNVADQMETIKSDREWGKYDQQLTAHAMAFDRLGLDGSRQLSPYQQNQAQEIMGAFTAMMQGMNDRNKTATEEANKQLGDGIKALSDSLRETAKVNADINKTKDADLYKKTSQKARDELDAAQEMLNGARDADEYAEALNRVQRARSAVNDEMKEAAADNYWKEQAQQVEVYAAKLDRLRNKNGGYDNWTQGQKDTFDAAQAQLDAMRQAVGSQNASDVTHARKMLTGLQGELNQQLMGSGKMIGGIGTGIDALTQKMLNMATPMMVWRKMSQMIRKAGENVKAIDTQMADLKKVTDNTTGEYQQFLRTTGETAIAIGAPISDLIQTTSTFAHMGYDLATSQQLGTVATKFGNTGNFANVNDAAETIIAVVNGFDGLGITDAGAVGDKLSAVAAKYAVTADDIATGLRNSASALNVAGNNVDQSTAMITAIAETTRDAGAAGSALKVLSMRIRGAKSELNDAGESTDGMAESTSKLREEVAALTNVTGKGGVDIMADPTTFKSTYEIMREISQVWDQMSDINQSALLEKLAGKVRSNQVAALLTNFSHAEGALEVSQNSAGTMDKIYSTWMDSIEAREKQFTAAQQALSQVAYSADIKKGMLQAGTTGLGLLTTLIGGGQSTGWLGDLLSGGSGHVSGIGTLGLGASLMSVLGAFRTGNGNVWSGVGNFFGMHRGAGGELQRVNTDWVSAYNNAFRDTGNKTSAMAAADAAIEKNGQVLDDWTRNLAESTDGVIDMSKATSGLSKVGQFAKSLGKNLLGGLAVAGTTALVSWGVSALADLLDREVFHKSEHLRQTASEDYAEYEQAKAQAEASEQTVKTIKEELGEIEKRRTAGQETAEDTRRYTQLQTQQRLAEIQARQDNLKKEAEARQALESQWRSVSNDYLKSTGLDDILYDAAQEALSSSPDADIVQAAEEYLQGLSPSLGEKEALAQTLVSAGIMGQDTWNAYRNPDWNQWASYKVSQRGKQAAERYGLTAEEQQYAGTMYAIKEIADGLTESAIKEAPERAVEQFAQLQGLMTQLGDLWNNPDIQTSMASGHLSHIADLQNINPSAIGSSAAATMSTTFGELATTIETLVTLSANKDGGLAESDASQMQPLVAAYMKYMEQQYQKDGKAAGQASYDVARQLLEAAGFTDALGELTDLAAQSKLNAETFKEVTNGLNGFSLILQMAGFDIQNGAEGFWGQIVKSATPETASGKPITTAWETRRDAVNKVTAARATGKEVWAATGYTGVLSEENYQQIKNLGGAYMDAVEYTHGGLIFNKDKFDAAIQAEYGKQLEDLNKESAAKQSEYNAATAKVAELMAERAKELASGNKSFSKQAELDNAVTAAAELGEQMRGYRRTAAQIQWQMGNAANWLSNKEGPEEGDEMREMSTAAAAIKAARKSGKTGTRQYAAAMQYLFGEGTKYSSLTKQDKNLITRMTKEDADSAKSAAAWQKEFQQAGILNKDLSMKDGFSYREMAAAYNKQFGTHVTEDMMRGAVGMMNEYIEDRSKQYYVRDTDDYAFGGRGGAEFQRAQEALTQAMSDYKKTTADATATEAERAKAEKTLTEAMGAYAETAKTLGMTDSQIADKIDETGKAVDQKAFNSVLIDDVGTMVSLLQNISDNTKPDDQEEKPEKEKEVAEASEVGAGQEAASTAGQGGGHEESAQTGQELQSGGGRGAKKQGHAGLAEEMTLWDEAASETETQLNALTDQTAAHAEAVREDTAAQEENTEERDKILRGQLGIIGVEEPVAEETAPGKSMGISAKRTAEYESATAAAMKAFDNANWWEQSNKGQEFHTTEFEQAYANLQALVENEESQVSDITAATQALNDAVAAEQTAAQEHADAETRRGQQEAAQNAAQQTALNAQKNAEDQAKARAEAELGRAEANLAPFGTDYNKLPEHWQTVLGAYDQLTEALESGDIRAIQSADSALREAQANARERQAEIDKKAGQAQELSDSIGEVLTAQKGWLTKEQQSTLEQKRDEIAKAIETGTLEAMDAAMKGAEDLVRQSESGVTQRKARAEELSKQSKELQSQIEAELGRNDLSPGERAQLEQARNTLTSATLDAMEGAVADGQAALEGARAHAEKRQTLTKQAGELINSTQELLESGGLIDDEVETVRKVQQALGDAIDSSDAGQLETAVSTAAELPKVDELLETRARDIYKLAQTAQAMGEVPPEVTQAIEAGQQAVAQGDVKSAAVAYAALSSMVADMTNKNATNRGQAARAAAGDWEKESGEYSQELSDAVDNLNYQLRQGDADGILAAAQAVEDQIRAERALTEMVTKGSEARADAANAEEKSRAAEERAKEQARAQAAKDAADLDRAERAEREAADAEASKADAVAKAQALLEKTVDVANQHPQGDKLTDAYIALDDALKGVKGKLTAGQIRELTKELNDAYAEATGGGAAEAEPAPSGSTISAERIPTQSNFTDMESVQMAMDGLHQTATEFEAAGHNLTQAQQDTLDDILGTTQQDYGSVAEATQAYDRARESMNELLGQYETGETDINARMREGQNAAAQMAQTEETANLAEAAEAMSNTAGDMGRTVEAVGEEALATPDAKNQAFEPQGAGAQGPQQSEQLVAPEVKVTVEQEPATTVAAPAAGATIPGTVAVEDFEVPDGTANITADTSGIGPAVASAVSSATSGGGSVSISVTADTSEAMSAIAEVIAAAGQGATIPVTAGTQMAQAAEGEDYASNSTYLVDEEGAELIEHVRRGTYELGTNNGARFTKLDRGDIVHTAKETRRILRRGQAFAMGGVVTGGARRSTSDQGATFASNVKSGNTHVSGGQAADIGKVAAAAAQAAGAAKAASEAAAASAKSDSKNTALENLVKWFSKLMDWIPTYLDILKKKTQDFIKAADTAAHYIGKNSNLNGAVEGLAAELYANEQALAKYKAFMDEVQSRAGFIPDIDTIVQRIKEGSIDITQYSDENTVKFIQAYQKWWDKAKGCLDTIEGLTDQLRELSKQKLDNIVNYFQQIQSLLDAQVKTLDSLIERKEAYGKELYADDYAKQLQLHQDIIDSATEERAALLREMAEQMGISEDMMLRIVSGGKGVWDKLAKEAQTGRILNPLEAPLPKAPEEKTEAPAEEQPAETPAPTEQQSPQYDELIKQLGSIGFISSEILKQNADVANATDATADVLSKQSSQSSSSSWEQIPGSGGTTKTTGGFFYGTGLSAGLSFGEFAGDYQDIGGNALSPGLDFTGGEEPEIVISAVEITDEAIQAVADALQLDITGETDEAKANLEAIKHILSAGWENPLMVGSDVWYDFITQLETIQGSIIETEIEMQGLRDKMYEIPLNNLKTEYGYLERIDAELEGINRMRDAQGSQAFAKTYRMLISNANKEIDCLEEQNKLLEQQLETLDPLSEKYQDIKKELDGNRDTISSIKIDQERWNDSIIDLQIAQLQKQNDAYKDQLSLMQALDELEKARQRRALVYHEDTGFVYEADEDEMEAAIEGVHDAVYQQMISDLERAKEDSNIYGPLGERLEQGGSILDYLGNTLVPVQDTLSGIDFTRYYQSIWDSAEQSGLLTAMLQSIDMAKLLQDSIGGNVSIDLSGMTLTGVDNVKELGDAIIQQLPNYLLQYLHGKGA